MGLGCPGHLPQNTHTHTLSARPSPGRNQCFLENGKLDYDQDMLRPFLFSWQSEQAGAPACALGLPPALTLSNGEDQVSFFPEALVQLWRPKEAMPESGESSPSNSWLDSFLGRKAQTITNLLSSRDSPPVSVGPGGGVKTAETGPSSSQILYNMSRPVLCTWSLGLFQN